MTADRLNLIYHRAGDTHLFYGKTALGPIEFFVTLEPFIQWGNIMGHHAHFMSQCQNGGRVLRYWREVLRRCRNIEGVRLISGQTQGHESMRGSEVLAKRLGCRGFPQPSGWTDWIWDTKEGS